MTLPLKYQRIIYIALLSIAGLLVLILLTGTIVGLARSDGDEPLVKLGKSGGAGQAAAAPVQGDDIRVFSGIGRLRITLSNSSILICSPAFPYQAADTAFTEELAAKIGEFRSIISDYFSSLTDEQITFLDEEAAKTEILRRINSSLRLGRIDAIYFSDMMIIDAS